MTRRLGLVLLAAAAAGGWVLALGAIPDAPLEPRGPVTPLVRAVEARPALALAPALVAAGLGLAYLAGTPLSRRRLAVALPLAAASLLPAVSGLAHWTLYAAFGTAAVVATAAFLEPWAQPLGAARCLGARIAAVPFGVFVVLAAALHGAVALGLSFGLFSGVPHVQDSVVQLFQARIFLDGAVAAPSPPVPAAFQYSHMLQAPAGWLSIYPPGHALLLAVGSAVGLPQAVNPLAGAVSVAGIVLLARDVLGERPARWAAALALVSPFLNLMHAGFMSHATAHAALVWAVLGWRRGARHAGRGWALAAGLLFGVAFLIRPYPAVLVGAALVAAALLERRPRALAACAWTALGALPGVALTLAYNAATTGDPLLFGYVARFGEAHLPGFHEAPWGPPHTPARGLVHVLADLGGLNRFFLGWPLPLTVLLGAGAVAGARPREAWLVTVPLALLAGHLGYWYADLAFGPRMVFESSFALAILTIQVLAALHERTGRRLAVVAVLAVAGSVPLTWEVAGRFGDAYWGVDGAESRTVAAAAPEDALVFVTGNYGGYLWRNDPRLEEGPVYVRHRGPRVDRRVRAAFPHRTPLLQRERELVAFPREP